MSGVAGVVRVVDAHGAGLLALDAGDAAARLDALAADVRVHADVRAVVPARALMLRCGSDEAAALDVRGLDELALVRRAVALGEGVVGTREEERADLMRRALEARLVGGGFAAEHGGRAVVGAAGLVDLR